MNESVSVRPNLIDNAELDRVIRWKEYLVDHHQRQYDRCQKDRND